MLVYSLCSRCESDISIKTNSITRSELEDEKGLYVDLRCDNCGIKQSVHVNQIYAKVSPKGLKLAIIFSIVFSVIMTLLLYQMGFWSTFTLMLPVIIVYIFHNIQAKDAIEFNKIKIDRK